MFPELFDLRETIKIHQCKAVIYINKLIKILLTEMLEIRELDPKYRDLEDEIDRQIEIWESAKCKGMLKIALIWFLI